MCKKCQYCEHEISIRGKTCRICKDGLYRYGLNRNDQLELYESQNKQCLLCETDIKMFDGHKGGFIDHDHKTGEVRGILCNRCNTIVGAIENHKDIFKVLTYLKL